MVKEEIIEPQPAQEQAQASTEPEAEKPITIIQAKPEMFQAIGQEVKEFLENQGISSQPEVCVMDNGGTRVELHSTRIPINELVEITGQAFRFTQNQNKNLRDPRRSGIV